MNCFQVIWPPLKEGAQALYNTIQKMELSPKHYEELLELYNARVSGYSDPVDARLFQEVSCTWLNRETLVGEKTLIKNYKRWSIVGKSKPKLRIGGIFPLNGSKFNAPELLPGKCCYRTD